MYAAGTDGLVELETDGHPIVPFVALDVQERPLSIDCTDGGVVLTEAVAHKPAGVMFAWDIQRTTYAVEGGEVTKGETEEIADNVLPRQLKAKYPDLVELLRVQELPGRRLSQRPDSVRRRGSSEQSRQSCPGHARRRRRARRRSGSSARRGSSPRQP